MLGVGASKKTYMDEVFSTYLYTCNNGNTININNGIDLAGEGGLTWTKIRSAAGANHCLYDTARGVSSSNSNVLFANTNAANMTSSGCGTNKELYSFNNNGFTLGSDCSGNSNWDTKTASSWSFRKTKGFFDIVTYTGDGASAKNISHSLGSIPGIIMVKRTDASSPHGDWFVWHRDLATNNSKAILLNSSAAAVSHSNYWNGTAPTASQFTVSHYPNQNNATYVAYLFAGGESNAATARSVDFDGSNDYLSIPDHDDFDVGTNWTAECWFKADALSGSYDGLFGQWTGTGNNGYILEYVGTELRLYGTSVSPYVGIGSPTIGQWHHVAISKEGSTTRIFLNGTQVVDDFDMGTISGGTSAFTIGGNVAGGGWFNGKISNVRIVKGTAVYTSSFRPPTGPLTNITNTVLLCCNDSSQTGSTVTPGTITNNGSTASSDSPFDDPAGFVFGENGDQNIIKSGSYVGTGSNLQDVFLGFEPQWVMIKCSSHSTDHTNWAIYDNMRGVVSGGDDRQLVANETDEEENGDNYANSDLIEFTSTGFKVGQSDWDVNHSANKTYVYMAIRRPDGYVGKPADAGTDVFAIDTGNSSSTQSFTSGFPVDFALVKLTSSSGNWDATGRLIQGKYLRPNSTNNEATWADYKFDQQDGFGTDSGFLSSTQSWMWKRNAGFDVVNYRGKADSAGVIEVQHVPHSLGSTPEMMWVKRRDSGSGTGNWFVYHKDLSHDSSNVKYIYLNNSTSEGVGSNIWNNTLPTATHFTVGGAYAVNQEDKQFLAMLFTSVDGISKVGSYAGDGTTNGTKTITTGFQPRFVLLRAATTGSNWQIADTLLGINTGNDGCIILNKDETNNQDGTNDWIDVTSTGFTVSANNATAYPNNNGETYIYYAHA